jgi:TetR/AcrR family transcriptional regulator
VNIGRKIKTNDRSKIMTDSQAVLMEVHRKSAPVLRKEQLVRVAEVLFAEYGFAGASIRDIAVAAGVKIGSIYNFFSGKRELHSAVLEKAYGSLQSYIERAKVVDGDPVGNLRRVMTAVTAFFKEQPTSHRVILQELLVGAEAVDRAIELHLRKARQRINDILRSGTRQGVFRDVDVEIFSYGLLSATFGYFSSHALFLRLFPEHKSAKTFIDNTPFPLFEFVMESLTSKPKK